ncbi:MAG: hypothetical protein ABSA63_04770 [Thermoplasmata archaeon]|jgi:hypothetical protein
MPAEGKPRRERNPYTGWIAAGIFLAVTFAAAAAIWFMFHPL